MTWVGFEFTIQDFERAKKVHTLESAATVIGGYAYTKLKQYIKPRQNILIIAINNIHY
jgi:hypothetical protein